MKTETAPETSEAVMDPLPYEAIRVVQLPILGLTFLEHLYCHVSCYARGRALGSRSFLGGIAKRNGWKDRQHVITGIQGVEICVLGKSTADAFSA